MRRTWVVVAALLLLGGCFGPDPNLTDSGKGRPFVTVEFPSQVEAGAVERAVVEIENPGPGDMNRVSVTFSMVGRPAAQGGVAPALVPVGSDHANEAIVSVDPEPIAVSQDGIVFIFEGIPEGGTKTIEFAIRVPSERGDAANAVIVSDAEDIERARGASIVTVIQ